MNFVALVTALDALASGRVDGADPARYGRCRSTSRTCSTRSSLTPPSRPALVSRRFLATSASPDRVPFASRERSRCTVDARIEDLGDLRVYGALESIDATGLTAAPLWDKALKVGDEVSRHRAKRDPTSRQGTSRFVAAEENVDRIVNVE